MIPGETIGGAAYGRLVLTKRIGRTTHRVWYSVRRGVAENPELTNGEAPAGQLAVVAQHRGWRVDFYPLTLVKETHR